MQPLSRSHRQPGRSEPGTSHAARASHFKGLLPRQLQPSCSTLGRRRLRGCLQEREAILHKVAEALVEHEEEIMKENEADVEAAEGKIDDQLMNRLRLKPQKIQQLADGIRSIAAQKEPLRKVMRSAKFGSGLYNWCWQHLLLHAHVQPSYRVDGTPDAHISWLQNML